MEKIFHTILVRLANKKAIQVKNESGLSLFLWVYKIGCIVIDEARNNN